MFRLAHLVAYDPVNSTFCLCRDRYVFRTPFFSPYGMTTFSSHSSHLNLLQSVIRHESSHLRWVHWVWLPSMPKVMALNIQNKAMTTV